jgi:hypothetical protein
MCAPTGTLGLPDCAPTPQRGATLLGAPVQTVASLREALGISTQAANTGIAALMGAGILHEATGGR